MLKGVKDREDQTSVIYNDLGYIHYKQGRLDDALRCLTRSIEISISLDPTSMDHSFLLRLSTAHNNRGLIHRDRGEYKEALVDMKKAFEMRQDDELLSEKQRRVLAFARAATYENLGLLYKDLEESKLAVENFQLALHCRQSHLNETVAKSHFRIAQIHNNMSLVLTNMGEYHQSIEHIRTAVDIQRKSLPIHHPNLAVMYNNMGQNFYHLGDSNEALKSFEESLKILRTGFRNNESTIKATINNIGIVMRGKGDYDGALVNFLEALEIQRSVAPNNADMARGLINVGSVYEKKTDVPTCVDYYRQALLICQRQLPANHTLTATAYFSLAHAIKVDDPDEAIDYFQRTLDIYRELNFPARNQVAQCHFFIGMIYQKRNHNSDALARFSEALKHTHDRILPSDERNRTLATIYRQMALCQIELEQFDDALKTYAKAVEHVSEDCSEFSDLCQAIEQVRKQQKITTDAEMLKDDPDSRSK